MSARPPAAVRLGLEPHREGGWYRRTWTSPTAAGGRPAATAILFLLAAGERSVWHRVDADELWLWHGPGTVTLHLQDPDEQHTLGPDAVQLLVPAGRRQCTAPADEEVLVTCVVSPGFEWSGFSLG
ncbi:cupin domain-containing protein [Modestobacter altitudinis]|uniref:cupin domain-containing protein n=1 Tax=Modestobacter altitudinis TaxID=2213158 RepID=UPI00110D0904|nr:cupin domain-containing protein [Modestobacter altitudinis]